MECANNIMRLKEYILVLLTVSFILFFSNGVYAKVGVQCSNCHTMHNSQDGAAVVYELNSGNTGYDTVSAPNNYLLKSDCAGCHSSTATATIDGDNTPIIFSTSTFSNPLAGGNFSYIIGTGNDPKGHNVSGITVSDTILTTAPGGTMTTQLTCAGVNGCHGDRAAADEYTAVKGAHHTDDTGGITGASIGLSYRFLEGILGTEDDDWEQDNTNTSHNEYKGSVFGETDTISYLCSECHGDFHGSVNTNVSSPFKRHPTDLVLPSSGEYNSYTSYSMTAPVARPTPGASSATVTPGTDIVMCLSCHRAHSSQYYKILRWDTKGTLADALSGCNVCHTSKN